MKSIFASALVVTFLVVGLVPVFAGETSTPATTGPPDPVGIDGPPLIVNGQTITPESICAGVDGAVVYIDDGVRYIAGFEGRPFLRIILSDGEVLETDEVTLSDDPSGAYRRGILYGELDELAVTMYLDDDLIPCQGLGDGKETSEPTVTVPATTSPEPPSDETVPPVTEPSGEEPVVEPGIDGPPLVINDRTYTPELICAGVDGAVVFHDDLDDIRYIAGFENGPFLRVILSDGEVLETDDVTFTEDPSGVFGRGILSGGFPEANITMYLDDGLAPCPENG